MSDLKWTALRHRMAREVVAGKVSRRWPIGMGAADWRYGGYFPTGPESRTLRALLDERLIQSTRHPDDHWKDERVIMTDAGYVLLAEWDAQHPEIAAKDGAK